MTPLQIVNRHDDQGNVTGGYVEGVGLAVAWQDGPLLNGQQTGAFVEDLLLASVARLRAYQDTRLHCRENALAITHIEEAIHWLEHRQRDRTARGVQGTYQE